MFGFAPISSASFGFSKFENEEVTPREVNTSAAEIATPQAEKTTQDAESR